MCGRVKGGLLETCTFEKGGVLRGHVGFLRRGLIVETVHRHRKRKRCQGGEKVC